MSLQTFIAKTLLKLPPNWLVRLSGGEPLELGGRTLEPQLQFVTHGAKRQPAMNEMTAQEGQEAARTGFAAFAAKPEPGVMFEDFTLPAPGRKIPVRLYRPHSQNSKHPLLVYYHMGGGVIGDVDTCHAFCSILSTRLQAPVLSVDYRLAPQHKFPAGLEDCLFAYEWALAHAAEYGAPAGEAAVGGDSMGGHFSAILCNEMKAEGKPQPVFQLLIYPAVDMVTEFPSASTYGDSYPLSTAVMDWFMDHYLPAGHDKSNPRLSPAFNTDMEGLAPAIIVTAGFDPLLDHGPLYAERLEEAGVKTVYKCFDNLCHGFTAFTAISPGSDAACREIADMARDLLTRMDERKQRIAAE
ncbi:MAG: alpha/beta hydrolase [Pseudomonadota bacterium]